MIQKLFTTMMLLTAILLGSASKANQPEEGIILTVSIDYEGEILKPEFIDAILAFRKKHPNVRFIHFLNAASFIVPGADPVETARQYRRIIDPTKDEIGLHIHSRKSLVERAGVHLRVEPAYLGDADPEYVKMAREQNLMPWQNPLPKTAPSTGKFGEIGDDVPFYAYTKEEQTKIIAESLKILAHYGFTGISSFRAGGWSASPDTWRALIANNIFIDSSAVPADILAEGEWKNSYLLHFNRQIWKGTTETSQPYRINLGDKEIMQFPNNGGLADYKSPQAFYDSFLATIQAHGTTSRPIIHIGFHLESAPKYLDNVSGGIELMMDYARKNNLRIKPETFKSSIKSGIKWAPTRHVGKIRMCKAAHL